MERIGKVQIEHRYQYIDKKRRCAELASPFRSIYFAKDFRCAAIVVFGQTI